MQYNGTNRHRQRLGIFNQYAEEPHTMAIHTGLSVTVAGHLIALERDEGRKVARVVVTVISGHVVTGLETEAVRAAAELLQRRAQRFLGDWQVVGLPNDFGIRVEKAG